MDSIIDVMLQNYDTVFLQEYVLNKTEYWSYYIPYPYPS